MIELKKYSKSIKFIIFIQILLMIYFSLIHQRGPIDVMKELRNDKSVESVHFLVPCHATPLYSHFHMNKPLKYLDCSPTSIFDESDVFHGNPLNYMNQYYDDLRLPSHFVFFEDTFYDNNLIEFFKFRNYSNISKLFHSHFSKIIDKRTSNYFLIVKK
jgi:GPI mannosyltransferase 3